MTTNILANFIEKARLPRDYFDLAQKWYFPLADEIVNLYQKTGNQLLIGINGCQGSGKSTLAELLTHLIKEKYDLNTIYFSLDDFYHTKAERLSLSKLIHPLLATRGVPGTHDTAFLHKTLLLLKKNKGKIEIPIFNKLNDDRENKKYSRFLKTPISIIILEGWCLGLKPQKSEELNTPINELERVYDTDGTWRKFVNAQLASAYREIFQMLDLLIMLKAPSFESVYNWRLQQENRMYEATISDSKRKMSPDELKNFIQHFERLTVHSLEKLPNYADYLFELNEQRSITKYKKLI